MALAWAFLLRQRFSHGAERDAELIRQNWPAAVRTGGNSFAEAWYLGDTEQRRPQLINPLLRYAAPSFAAILAARLMSRDDDALETAYTTFGRASIYRVLDLLFEHGLVD